MPAKHQEKARHTTAYYIRVLDRLAHRPPCAFIHFEGFARGTAMCGQYDPRYGCRPCEVREAMEYVDDLMAREAAHDN